MSKSLYSVTPDPFTGGGIFTALQALDPPWADEGIAAQLDLIYYGNVSGSKLVSPLVERLMTGSKLSAVETATLAGALMATNGARWGREWATRSAQYDPIENYRMVEEMTDDETVTEYGRQDTRTDNLAHGETRTDNLQHSETRTDNLQHSETRTDNLQHSETRTDNLAHSETRTDNLSHRKTGTETSTPDVTVTENSDVYGFNSSSAVHDSKRTQSSDGTSTTTYNLTETDTGTVGTQGSDTGTQSTQGSNTGTVGTQGSDTGTQGISGSDTGTQSTQGTDTGTQTSEASGSDTSTRNYQLTRSGNIGVTTSQQMLQSERDLWMWNFFYDVVFPDVDTVLTIPIYAEEDDSGVPGGVVPTGTIAIIANGNYDVTSFAAANVNVSQPTGEVNIVTNGRHDISSYEYADVLVPNTYVEEDEGKAVRNGELVAQSPLMDITENGNYDTTYVEEVEVSIPNAITSTRAPLPSEGSEGTIWVEYVDSQVVGDDTEMSYVINITSCLRGGSNLGYASAAEIDIELTNGTNTILMSSLSDFTYSANGGSISRAFDGDASTYWEKGGLPAIVTMKATIPDGYYFSKLKVIQRSDSYNTDIWQNFTVSVVKDQVSTIVLSEENLSQSDWSGAGVFTLFTGSRYTVVNTYVKIGTGSDLEWVSPAQIEVQID